MKQLEPPVCIHCATPMVLNYRERVTGHYTGILLQDEEDGSLAFQVGDSYETGWDEQEYWWVCPDLECQRSLQRDGGDWPYEIEFEGDIEHV